MNFTDDFHYVQTLHEQRRLRSAISAYMEALENYPEHSIVLSYNLGAIYQTIAGNAEKAHQFYEMTIKKRSLSNHIVKKKGLDQLEANACENLMQLSASYDEYEKWGTRLRKLQPENEIFHIQWPNVQDGKNQGHPWTSLLTWMAHNFLRDGIQGFAASIFNLMLKNRKRLRISRQDYRVTVLQYASSVAIIFADCFDMLQKSGGNISIDEIDFIIEDALPFIEEYCDTNPSDDNAQKSLKHLYWCLESTKDLVDDATKKGGNFVWQMSESLVRAIKTVGLGGLQFKLRNVRVDPDEGTLVFTFVPINTVPPEKAYPIGLALRAIVGLTLPLVAGTSRELQLMQPTIDYVVKLGPGVPIRAFSFSDGVVSAGPFQVTGFEENDTWYSVVKPVLVRTGSPYEFNAQREAQIQIFRKFVPIFNTLKALPIQLHTSI